MSSCFFVTGGAKRIGRSIALTLAELGHDIALHYHSSEEEAKSTQQECMRLGVRCELIQANLNDITAVDAIIDSLFNLFDNVVGMIHSASVFQPISFHDATPEDWMTNMTVNMVTPILLSQAYVKRSTSGQIIHLLDADPGMNDARYFPYMASKRAFEAATQMMAKSLAPEFRVNAIAPGWILTKSTGEPDNEASLSACIPLKRQGSLEDINQAVRYLVAQNYLNGQIIYVDGGRHLNPILKEVTS